MCGIVGTFKFRGRVDRELLIRQRDSLRHRGPDSEGFWSSADGAVGFGHRRLAIIDLTEGGHQPKVDSGTGNVITFNGEIYNFRELRAQLMERGHVFSSESDTEVILAAYREWDTRCVEYLDGMFAFSLFDPTRQRVLLARDRAGEKPLFLHQRADGISFASEIKALLLDPAVPRRVRRQSLNEYLAYGYVSGEHTMFADITRLPPASRMEVDLRTGECRVEKYWQLPNVVDAADESPEGATDRLHNILRNALRRQLISDVPVGVLLSGGVDSSLVTAIAAEVSETRIRTFTVRFPGHEGFDEGPFARLVADHLGTDHTEIVAAPADEQLVRDLVRQFDDPISDSSMIPTFMVSREIRRFATVAIGGDGGDELFGGYHRYPAQIRQHRMRSRVPQLLRAPMAALASAALPRRAPGRAFAMGLADDSGAALSNAGRIFRVDERRALSAALTPLDETALAHPEHLRQHLAGHAGSALRRATALDFSTYMVDDVLVKVDRASMLASLEVRAPFLDRATIEFAFGELPDSLRATEADRKIILRRLGQRVLPKSLDLRRKQGFSIPIDSWMKSDWSPLLDDVMSSKSDLVSRTGVSDYRRRLSRGQAVGERLFALIVLAMWEQEYRITDIV